VLQCHINERDLVLHTATLIIISIYIVHIIITLITLTNYPVSFVNSCCSAAHRSLWPPHSLSLYTTHSNTPQRIGLVWTSDQPVAHIATLKTDIRASGGIRTRNLNRNTAEEPRRRPPAIGAGKLQKLHISQHCAVHCEFCVMLVTVRCSGVQRDR
jgi:hypothetical protein